MKHRQTEGWTVRKPSFARGSQYDSKLFCRFLILEERIRSGDLLAVCHGLTQYQTVAERHKACLTRDR
jgi:hypothetical protein